MLGAHAHIRAMRLPLPVSTVLLAALAAAGLAACNPAAGDPPDPSCFRRSSEKVGGPFHLTAHTGSPTTEANFKGRKTLIFFGYTYCPDICPVTLFNLGKAMESVPENKRPRTVFVSVDPARDTPDQIARYIRSNGFPEDIIGLTGTLEELQQVNEAFMTRFSRDEVTDPTEAGYTVSHSSILYLMDEDWKLLTYFTQSDGPDAIARCLKAIG
jgi:protein SCO1/2